MSALGQELGTQDSRTAILGVPVNASTMDETIDGFEKLILTGEPHIVVTADASGIVIAQEDPELLAIYRSASWVTADSNGVVWALRRKGIETERVSGVDVADRLFALSAQKGYRVFLLGSSPGVAEEAAERIRLKHPGCNIVGTRHGFFPADDDKLVAEEVAPFEPDILLVAMGIPRQEKFIAATQEIIKAKVAIGVGGTLDVMSGRVKRAPAIIQKMKLEWLWRTLLNPKKFSKAKTLPKFASLVLRNKE
ncbi:MAG: WecB/TagA/CpsF family glycosyltransferase [Fimbriimonadaceae bacterium]|nr:WecB/TagA/CpsF family glycosyltransferase [Fimbriimonadaceae bacterium]